MTTTKRTKTVVGSLAGLLLVGGIAATGIAAANASTNPAPTASSNVEQGNQHEATIKSSITVAESKTEQSDAAEAAKLATLATVNEKGANAAALAHIPGSSLVGTSLEDENGSVVYQVSVKDKTGVLTDVTIDAGNAKVLATEAGDTETADATDQGDHADAKDAPEQTNGTNHADTPEANDSPDAPASSK